MKVFTVAQMVAAEKAADAQGHSYAAMMELAGRRTAQAIMARQSVAGRRMLALLGPGNNGGDGLVAGRYLAEAGADVMFYLTRRRDPATDENLARVLGMGLLVVEHEQDQRWRVLRTRLAITDMVLDALLGTGFTRPIEGRLAQLLRQVQAGLAERNAFLAGAATPPPLTPVTPLQLPPTATPARVFIVAVDCPSGLNCDTGALDPLTLPADLTVTFAGPKWGHFLEPGADACGELVAAEIGIDPRLTAGVTLESATPAALAAHLPTRPAAGHKGTFGFGLVVGGSHRYWGAPALAARAALRIGCGLVALGLPAAIRLAAALQLPEATYEPLPDENNLGAESAAALFHASEGGRPPLARYVACLLGPGLGPESASFMQAFLTDPAGLPPLVVDADGLNHLAAQPDWPHRLPAGSILTPHVGEMRRLAGVPPANNLILWAQQQAAAWGHIVVLKSARTVVAAPTGDSMIFPFPNPALATAGSGDVLAGAILGLLTQGVTPYWAACLGVYLHALAGQQAAVGSAGLLAHEIAEALPAARAQLAAVLPPNNLLPNG